MMLRATDATLLNVTCCVRLHTLLRVVGSCCAKFESSQILATIRANGHNNSQQYWELLANKSCVRLHGAWTV